MSVAIVLCFAAAAATAVQHGPFSSDFVNYLERNPERNEYVLSAFKEYGTTGTFGGKLSGDDKVNNHPVVFVHGNMDSALHHSDRATGWTKSVEHFKNNGYTAGELYGMTYGSRNFLFFMNNRIYCRDLLGMRRFFDAILEYTGSEKIDVVAHGMGVTIARKAIQGGQVELFDESCSLGEPLSDRVDSLVAISGANYGLCMCDVPGVQYTAICSQAGFSPNVFDVRSKISCYRDVAENVEYSSILRDINEASEDNKDADFVASLWSNDDIVTGKDNLVWGKKTSLVPNSDLSHAYSGLDNIQSKDDTVHDQISLVTKHKLHGGRAKRHHH